MNEIATSFVNARKAAQPLQNFPGIIPDKLDEAYQIQDYAIELWKEQIGGWKVGRIPVAIEEKFGIDRLAGPIFSALIHKMESGGSIELPMFVGGFAAIEAEFIAVIARDTPPDKLKWSLQESEAMIADLCIGLEVASSPLATINELGPPVVVSDFGNNFGLVVGPSIKNWRTRALETMQCSSSIEGQQVGTGGAFTLTGGFVRSVQFILELTASRGRRLRAGDVIATGQTTGIHDVKNGQLTQVEFGDDGHLSVKFRAAKPAD